ncbi:PKD domain-containing protein, partial [Leptolyngbya cf. ectocarpi LEGE 11479]
LQTVSNTILEREQQRLTQKYGTNHPRVQKVMRRLTYNKAAKRELERQIETAKIQVPAVSRQTWMVHGRVFASQQKGIEGLILSLFDEQNRWIRAIEIACTDERGYFAIRYPIPDSSAGVVSPKQPLTLTVTDGDRKILHQEKRPLFVRAGLIDYREIILDGEPKDIVTPEPEEPTPPTDLPSKPVQVRTVNGPSALQVGQTGTFTAVIKDNSTPPVKLVWDFGDNTGGDGLTTTHSYTNPGTYTVKLTATNAGGEDSKTTTVTVRPVPTNQGLWQVRGRIQAAAGQPLSSLRVGLRDQNGEDRFELGSVQPNDAGAYVLRYSSDEFSKLFQTKPDLFLVVTNAQGEVLFRATNPFQPEVGQVDQGNVAINRTGRRRTDRGDDRSNPRRR